MGMIKELYLEYKRWKEDNKINKTPCTILMSVSETSLVFEDTQVQFLKVGDVLKLTDNDYVPADCVILKASQDHGQCFT